MSILVIMCTLRIDIDPGLVFEYCHPLWLLLITVMVIMIILTTTRAAALNLDSITPHEDSAHGEQLGGVIRKRV